MTLLGWIVVSAGFLGIIATALPLLPIGAPAVRIWDFPRIQIAALLSLALLSLPFAFEELNAFAGLLATALIASLIWQVNAIIPYTQLRAREVASASSDRPTAEIRLLAANVLIENRSVSSLLRIISKKNPDVILLMETDAWWDEQLKTLKQTYPHVVAQPQENSYGMHLFSRFELENPHVRYLVDGQVPSIKTLVRLGSDFEVSLHCVHPEPPPFVNSEQRDAELLIVGKDVRKDALPTIVAGDLNDVAWSKSTRLFQKVSGLLDPRIGRGMFNTFSAKLPFFLRWPLDHVFFSDQFHLVEVSVLDDIGSDHFPFFVHLAYFGGSSGEKPTATPDDKREAEQTIQEGRQLAANPDD